MIQIFLFIICVISLTMLLIFFIALIDSKTIKDKLICLIFCLIFSTILYKFSSNFVKTINEEERYGEFERSTY